MAGTDPKTVAPKANAPVIPKGHPTNDDVTGVDKVVAILAIYPTDVHDDHVVYGYGGFRLTVGDLREIAE